MYSHIENTLNTRSHVSETGSVSTQATSPDKRNTVADINDIQTKKDVNFSSLAKRLSDSATRAEADNTSLSREALDEKAAALLKKITGPTYDANRTINNAEIPDSNDPERLASAAEASKFVNGNGRNPFSGFSREKLALITYDDSGLYTTNERRAAWEESYDQEYSWRKEAVDRAMAEYNETGKLTDFFSAVLKQFNTLPAIEQAQYPGNYAIKLQKWIDLDYNYSTNTLAGKDPLEDIISL